MSKRLVIAVDCDDVLVPSGRAIIDAYNLAYGTMVTLADLYNIDSSNWQADSTEEMLRRVDELLKAGAIDNLVPDSVTIQEIRLLADQHELHLVTGRQSYMEPVTERLVSTYFPNCFQTIEHTNYYAASDSGARKRTKGEVCQEIGADMLIDDHITHGEVVLAAGVKEVIIWGDYPWNRADILAPGMTRCTTWEQVLREVGRVTAIK